MKELISKLKNSLYEAVPKDDQMGLLFSGGLDSSVIAAINPSLKAINVSLEEYGEDLSYASYLAKVLKLDYFHRRVKIEEAIDVIPEVVRMLKTFDPALPNDIVVYFGMKKAKEFGVERVLTGDGSDELFGGYSFMRDIPDLETYIKRISGTMQFSSNEFADFFGMRIGQPYLDKQIIDLALKMPIELKIKEDSRTVWGKWALRKAFEEVLPQKIIWQSKRPLESGSGMEKIREVLNSKVSDADWKHASETLPIKFINREHYYYYTVYKNVVGDIPKPEIGENECAGCGAGIKKNKFHCKICGYVSDWRRSV